MRIAPLQIYVEERKIIQNINENIERGKKMSSSEADKTASSNDILKYVIKKMDLLFIK